MTIADRLKQKTTGMIYKICTQEEWNAALTVGEYCGSKVDTRDGFIHFSAAHQVRETAQKHFTGQTDLVLLEVDEELLGTELKWEVSRENQLFPHLFGPLPASLVRHVYDLRLTENGQHQFPEGIV